MAESKYTIDALLRGLSILSLFAHGASALSLAEITAATGMNKTTAFRIATTLEQAGFLRRDPDSKRFYPGVMVLQLGYAAISSLDIRQVARPFLDQLSRQVGETVSMSILDGMEIVFIDRVINRQIVGMVLGFGSRLPAHCASMGKAMLAYLPEERLQRLLEEVGLHPCTPNSLIARTAFEAELEAVRQRGYAINDEELEIGLRAVAAPVWDGANRVVAAANITGSTATISRERLTGELAPAVKATAAQISHALGYLDSGKRMDVG
jgi:PcaR/PcaU/PobR family beta-ketoadipate pathway transcriptional regulator